MLLYSGLRFLNSPPTDAKEMFAPILVRLLPMCESCNSFVQLYNAMTMD
jgi:hypothetical protein